MGRKRSSAGVGARELDLQQISNMREDASLLEEGALAPSDWQGAFAVFPSSPRGEWKFCLMCLRDRRMTRKLADKEFGLCTKHLTMLRERLKQEVLARAAGQAAAHVNGDGASLPADLPSLAKTLRQGTKALKAKLAGVRKPTRTIEGITLPRLRDLTSLLVDRGYEALKIVERLEKEKPAISKPRLPRG